MFSYVFYFYDRSLRQFQNEIGDLIMTSNRLLKWDRLFLQRRTPQAT